MSSLTWAGIIVLFVLVVAAIWIAFATNREFFRIIGDALSTVFAAIVFFLIAGFAGNTFGGMGGFIGGLGLLVGIVIAIVAVVRIYLMVARLGDEMKQARKDVDKRIDFWKGMWSMIRYRE